MQESRSGVQCEERIEMLIGGSSVRLYLLYNAVLVYTTEPQGLLINVRIHILACSLRNYLGL